MSEICIRHPQRLWSILIPIKKLLRMRALKCTLLIFQIQQSLLVSLNWAPMILTSLQCFAGSVMKPKSSSPSMNCSNSCNSPPRPATRVLTARWPTQHHHQFRLPRESGAANGTRARWVCRGSTLSAPESNASAILYFAIRNSHLLPLFNDSVFLAYFSRMYICIYLYHPDILFEVAFCRLF